MRRTRQASVPPLGRDGTVLAAAFVVSGTVHLVRPQVFEPIVPRFLPAHRALVHWSGVAELVAAAAMVAPRTRRRGGLLALGVLLGVYPANVQMAVDAVRGDDPRTRAAALGRLPLQLPMLRTAHRLWRG